MKRILVADDNAEIQMVLRYHLNLNGYEVDIAKDGVEALKMYEENDCKYDLLIFDAAMPNLTGFDAAFYVRNANNGRRGNTDIRIVILTADDSPFSKARSRMLNAEHWLKPIAILNLNEMVSNLLNDHQNDHHDHD